jgi:hypothetical protein
MSERLELSDAAIAAMLARRARRAYPGDLAWVALEAVRRTPARSQRPWDRLVPSPRLASGSQRWLWVAVAATLALALVGGLLAAGGWRLLQRLRPLEHPYPILTGASGLWWNSIAVSGDELWTITSVYTGAVGGLGERSVPPESPLGLAHYVGNAWQGPVGLPALDGENVIGMALGPDGTLWVAGERTVALLRDGASRVAWKAGPSGGLKDLAVAADGTVWVAQGRDLIGLTPSADGYSARSVTCPDGISRIAATTDGSIYVGGFMYNGGNGLARSDGSTCASVDPLGDGRIHEVSGLSAGRDGGLLASVFDESGNACCRRWVAMLHDGRWSTISGPTFTDESAPGGADGLVEGVILAPDGHPWGIGLNRGLMRYEDGAWGIVVAGNIHTMAVAPDGVLWYETDRGIERIRTDEVAN